MYSAYILTNEPSAASLTPIPINHPPVTPVAASLVQDDLPGGLRGRVEQQVDTIADSASKVISGVVDSFGMLRLLLPARPPPSDSTNPPDTVQSLAPWNVVSPRFGLLRRESFSIASIAASLPGAGGRRSIHSVMEEDTGQQLLVVPRTPSVRSGPNHEEDNLSGEKKNEEDLNDENERGIDDRKGENTISETSEALRI